MSEPDIRFSLANERTALAWVRTSLGLFAAAAALSHFLPSGTPAWITVVLVVILALGGLLSALAGSWRFRANSRAICNATPYVPPTYVLIILSVILASAGVAVAISSAVFLN